MFCWNSPWSEDGFVRPLKNTYMGKSSMLDSVGSLGLVLCWYRTRGNPRKTLVLSFGLSKSNIIVWIRFGKRVLLHVLQNHPDVLAHIASDENIAEMDAYVDVKCNSCGDILGDLDGLKINFDKPGHMVI